MAGKGGGKQPGAGRPKGAIAKRTQELIDKATLEGISPMEVLLGNMRFYYNLAQKVQAPIKGNEEKDQNYEVLKKASNLMAQARECAIAVSPYIHPKLSSVDAKVSISNQETALAELE